MRKNNNKTFFLFLPLIFAILVCVGIWIGVNLGGNVNDLSLFQHRLDPSNKIQQVLDYVEKEYVDSVNREELVEATITEMLHKLDPHSNYYPAKDFEDISQSLEGNFEGIGIEFNVVRDTIRVVTVIAGGPSQSVGLMPGDQIIKIEDTLVAGIKLKNKEITSKLRGKKGTKVSISVKRRNFKKLLDFTITRGEIPIHSIDVSYMIDKEIGYIKLNRFAETSYDEFMDAVKKLKSQGMVKLIFDLRDNGGGLLDIAVMICDEFLADGKMIVYTKGRVYKKEERFATKSGSLTDTELVILIDENSASASEIVAGAIQDNDRGTIIGRRSFGKGLVQRQTELSDGSALRLTTARYYTPTGRCIQKSYEKGYEEYMNEEFGRFGNGELINKDSIHFSDSAYTTPKGKVVYGGGGIMPDIFIPLDTSTRTEYLNTLFFKGIINQFAFDYTDKKRGDLQKLGIVAFRGDFEVTDALLNELSDYAARNGVEANPLQLKKSAPLIRTYLKAAIARNIWGNDGFYPIFNAADMTFRKAVESLR